MLIQLIFPDNLVCHGHAEGLHRMGEGVVIGPDHLVEVVDYIFVRVHYVYIIAVSPLIICKLIFMDEDEFNDF